jgi:hypothetical protein
MKNNNHDRNVWGYKLQHLSENLRLKVKYAFKYQDSNFRPSSFLGMEDF